MKETRLNFVAYKRLAEIFFRAVTRESDFVDTGFHTATEIVSYSGNISYTLCEAR